MNLSQLLGAMVEINHKNHRPVALVTGASRGIGRAIALALAEGGYDLVITGRTIAEGAGINPATGHHLPGSLTSTAECAQQLGAQCHTVVSDVLDLEDIEPSFQRCLTATSGRIDLLVNNAIYVGSGNDLRFADSEPADIIRRTTGNFTAPLLFTHAFLQHALNNDVHPGTGWRATILNITSDAGQRIPQQVAGEGGWSLMYGATKAGFHRMAEMLALEYGTAGIRAININPGLVTTERVLDTGVGLQWVARSGVAPAVIGVSVLRLLTDQAITNGAYIHAQQYLAEHLGKIAYQDLLLASQTVSNGQSS